MLRSRFQTDLKIALSNAENLRLPQTAFLFLLTLHHFQNLSWKSYKVLFRSARTSCNTSGRSVPARQIWITYIHASICLMNHQKTHQTNSMAPWHRESESRIMSQTFLGQFVLVDISFSTTFYGNLFFT